MDLGKQKPEQPGMELGFQPPQTGTYIMEILEGIDIFISKKDGEETPGRSIMVPLKVDRVHGTGDEESVGRKTTYFITMISKEGKKVDFGEKQVVNLLACVKLLDKFAGKYKGDIDPLDPKFVTDIQLRLPGKFIVTDIETKDKRANVNSVMPVTGKASSGGSATAKTETATDGDDW